MSSVARPAICLNMIVRNEAHIVREVLDAVAPYITSWVIVDTGSEDGTQELIRGHMAGLGIPGELHERPWRDFGHNRSEALALAKGHGEYIWVMDADDTVVGTPDFTGLSADTYLMRICDSDTFCTYWRRQLFRDGMRWHYVGVIHEYAHCKDPYVEQRLEGEYYIESRRLGGRNLDPQKYERDADLLFAEVERNPDDARSVFLLAQSYFNQGDYANARSWDARRAEMGGWDEEVYYSICRVAESMFQLGEPWPNVQDAYLSAWEFRPTRAEPLYAIASAYRADHRYQLGHLFASRAAELPFPEEDLLFVRADIYNWRALDERAICAAGLGKHEEAFTLCRRLLARRGIPDEDRKRIAANRDTVAPTMIDAATPHPDMLAGSLVTGPPDCEVTVSLIAGPDRAATEQTLNSFLRSCIDVSRVGRVLVLDAGLSAQDRATLLQRYRFIEFSHCPSVAGPGAQLAHIRAQIGGRFWLHLGQGWRFFAPESFISRLTAVLDAEPTVFQVAINFGDAQHLTGACAGEDEVRRGADAGRYLPTDVMARGPAMFDTARLDHAGGIDSTDPDPIAGLGRRAAAAGLHTASLDEVLCIAKLTSEASATARTDSDSWNLASSVGATATMAAASRALATQLRFIDDPFAAPLVRAVGLDFVTRLVDGDIPNLDHQQTAQGMAVRTGFFDHFFLDAARAGIRQAVILASGLDARVYRLPWPHGTVVYEVDVPEVIEFKTTTLAGLGAQPKAALRIVAVDLRGDWPQALREAGFATDRPAAWIAEGLLVYLPPDAQDALFDHITALSAPGSRLATEFLPDPNVLLDQRSMELQERLRAAGFGIDFKELVFHGKRSNVVDYLAGHGWSVVSSRTVEQLLAEHGFTYPNDQSARAFADQRFVSAVLSA
jgi:methyltransferase (TIGR00027 family)